ncbi:uncharacterized protein J4E78_003588 [Alternaria triticimaculans]|uniref:uncharacterized protein n=1 Tax=Alternaria triticimaculans TaxID=297637 RepID=UPI0020C2134B|nr:uncharacterized protein J4E78_003588 [Alternaria triticimaculans]KAI4666121.1 hypothetical protein J4E78_003588 [Alternaria triticimaculans]
MQQAIRTVDIGQAYLIAYVKPLTETLTSLISAQISELREHLDQVPVSPDPDDEVANEVPGPELLFGRNLHATREELLAALPLRPEADRLIDTFFISMESHPSMFTTSIEERPLISPALIHKPTFLKQLMITQYNELWTQPFETSTMWLGVLYAALALGFRFQAGVNAHQPDDTRLAPDLVQIGFYREKAAQFMSLDFTTSSQAGLPRTIMPSTYDTQEPRNLSEDDLHEDMLELPPSRPETELTQLLYSIVLTRLRSVQARIVDLVNATSLPPYGEITEMDATLRDVFEKIPQSPTSNTFDDPNTNLSPDFMRYTYLNVAFLKAELMLHRPYFVLGRTDSRYAYSRRVCLNAAIEMLRFQSKLDAEVQPGGWRLSTLSLYMSSIIAQDFLLATTVLVVELDEGLIAPIPPASEPMESGVQLDHASPTQEEIIASLRSAYHIWIRASKRSQEARKVATAVKLVLSKVHGSGIFDTDNLGFAVPDSDAFDMGDSAFGHPFDFGFMPMDLDQYTLPLDWGDAFPNLQPQPLGQYPPGSFFQQ